jgi:hypothetical protein
MGALIQTKGTQRLANLFNTVFLDLRETRDWRNENGDGFSELFSNSNNSLRELSDEFIAQVAVPRGGGAPFRWPNNNGNDILYPSATMNLTAVGAGGVANRMTFTLPAGIAARPSFIANGALIRALERKKALPRGTVAANVTNPAAAGGTFTVDAQNPPGTALPVPANAVGTKISFASGRHGQLVRRWRWYLDNDLQDENHAAIRRAILRAIDDDEFRSITFQTIEDTQKVLIQVRNGLDGGGDNLTDILHMDILLMSQQTTAPDVLDPQ